MKTIFDLGCNNGQNFEYYFNRADKIIAVEANPILCQELKVNFKEAIEDNSLVLLNAVLVENSINDGVPKPFFVDKNNDLLSSRELRKSNSTKQLYHIIPTDILTLIENYVHEDDDIELIKIDLEGFDLTILSDLIKCQKIPNFITFENHSKLNIQSIIDTGFYRSFKIVEGRLVKNMNWTNIFDGEKKNFRNHEAGPFGNDIDGRWMNEKAIKQYIYFRGEGWWDICASRASEGKNIGIIHIFKGLFRRLYEIVSKNKVKFKGYS